MKNKNFIIISIDAEKIQTSFYDRNAQQIRNRRNVPKHSKGHILESAANTIVLSQSHSAASDSLDPTDCSSSVHRVLLPRILEWVAIPFSRGSSQTRDQIKSRSLAFQADSLSSEHQEAQYITTDSSIITNVLPLM